MWYLVVFFGALAVDLIPVIAPPAWTVMVFLYLKFHLNLWGVLVAGVLGSTLGRFLMGLYLPKFSDKLIKQHKQDDLEFLGKKLGKNLWQSWLFVFAYTVTPLSSTALFTAAGMGNVKPIYTVPPYFCGKCISDGLMLYLGHYAASHIEDLYSVKAILAAASGLMLVGMFLFTDWHALLQKKKFRFSFRIWK